LTLLEARGVWFQYPGGPGPVLRGVGLSARGGEVVAVAGPTGSGKSTLLLVLAGLLAPQRGEVLLDGRPLGAWARRRIGLLFQNPDDMLFNPTVYDEVAYALRGLGLGEDEVRRRVEEAAGELGVGGLLAERPYRLSVGQKKLVALASVLAYGPDVLLLDEPFANLDRASAERLRAAVLRRVEEGAAAVVVTHMVDTVLELADRLCLLEAGALRCLPACRAVAEGVLEATSMRIPVSLRLLVEKLGWGGVAELLPRCRGEAAEP